MPDMAAVIAERLASLQAQKADLVNRIMRVDVAIEELTYLQKQVVLGESVPVVPDPAGAVSIPPQAHETAPTSGVVLSPKTHTPVANPVEQLKATRRSK